VSDPTLDINELVVVETPETTDVVVKSLLSTLILFINVPVDLLIPVTAEPVVKSLLSTLMLFINEPVDLLIPVTADPVVKSLLSTLMLFINEPVLVDIALTTLVVAGVTSVNAVPVDWSTPCPCPVYLTTLPAVVVENVTVSPGLIGPSAMSNAIPATSTLTLCPAAAESRDTPITFLYVAPHL